MEETNESIMGRAFQEIEDKETGGLVGSFVAIAEVSDPNYPDGMAYRYLTKGSPAMLLGLHQYLGDLLRQDVADGMEDD